LFRAAQSLAAIQGQASVSIDHVRALVEPVLAHRLLVRRDALKEYPDAATVVREIAGKISA
jgi:MoxR-like ATPase